MRARAEQRRAAILEAAEAIFSEKGFAAARLQDIAHRVGIRRASLVYYFRDKRELYDAVLDSVFGDATRRYDAVLATTAPLPTRVEAVVETWVKFVAERPSVARILLRETAEFIPAENSAVARHAAPAIAAVARAIREGQRAGLFHRIDPVHFIMTVVGGTVFFVSATPALSPAGPFNPLSPEQLNMLRVEVLAIARRLLGIDETASASSRHRRAPAVRPRTYRRT